MPSQGFIELLLGSFGGQICASNIVAGLETGAINATFVSSVFYWWERLVDHQRYAEPEAILLALNMVRDRSYPDTMAEKSTAPDFRMIGPSEVDPSDLRDFISCALPAAILPELVDRQNREDFISHGINFPASSKDPWAADMLDALLGLEPSKKKVRIDPTKRVGTGLVWFTKRRSLRNVAGEGGLSTAPDRIRDSLGLVHRGRDEVMVILSFPASILNKTKSARPTFVDAGDHSRFKCRPDSNRARKLSTWGWTADLKKFHEGDIVIDGCRERVCADISGAILPDGGYFTFEPLRPLAVPREDTRGKSDDRFALRLRRRMTLDDLKSTLMAIP